MFRPIRLAAIFAATAVTAVTLLATGCASFNQLNNEVSTFGAWPAQRAPTTYVFERLPSQAGHPERQRQLEDAARGAVEAAGFKPAADAAQADVTMQLAAHVSLNDPWFYNDPFPWRGSLRFGTGWGHGRWGRSGWGTGLGLGFGYGVDSVTAFEREVAVLIRDRKTGELLYEARASNNGSSNGVDALLPAMFRAAMQGFPAIGPNPRNVMVQVSAK